MDLYDRFFEIPNELYILAGQDVDSKHEAEILEMLVSEGKSHAPSPAALHLIKGLNKNEFQSVKDVLAELVREAKKIKGLVAQIGHYGSSVSSGFSRPLPMHPPVLIHPQKSSLTNSRAVRDEAGGVTAQSPSLPLALLRFLLHIIQYRLFLEVWEVFLEFMLGSADSGPTRSSSC